MMNNHRRQPRGCVHQIRHPPFRDILTLTNAALTFQRAVLVDGGTLNRSIAHSNSAAVSVDWGYPWPHQRGSGTTQAKHATRWMTHQWVGHPSEIHGTTFRKSTECVGYRMPPSAAKIPPSVRDIRQVGDAEPFGVVRQDQQRYPAQKDTRSPRRAQDAAGPSHWRQESVTHMPSPPSGRRAPVQQSPAY